MITLNEKAILQFIKCSQRPETVGLSQADLGTYAARIGMSFIDHREAITSLSEKGLIQSVDYEPSEGLYYILVVDEEYVMNNMLLPHMYDYMEHLVGQCSRNLCLWCSQRDLLSCVPEDERAFHILPSNLFQL